MIKPVLALWLLLLYVLSAKGQSLQFGGVVLGSANQDYVGILAGTERILKNDCPGTTFLTGQEFGLHLNLRASEFFRLRGEIIEEWRPFVSYTGYVMLGVRAGEWQFLGGVGIGCTAAFGPEVRIRQLISLSVIGRAALQWRNVRLWVDPVYSPVNEYGGVYRSVNYSDISGKISLIWLWRVGKRSRELPCVCW